MTALHGRLFLFLALGHWQAILTWRHMSFSSGKLICVIRLIVSSCLLPIFSLLELLLIRGWTSWIDSLIFLFFPRLSDCVCVTLSGRFSWFYLLTLLDFFFHPNLISKSFCSDCLFFIFFKTIYLSFIYLFISVCVGSGLKLWHMGSLFSFLICETSLAKIYWE